MEKKPAFLFIKIAYTPHHALIRHIAWLHVHVSRFQDTMLFFFKYRDENDFAPDDQHYIRGKVFKRNTLCLATFLKEQDKSSDIEHQPPFGDSK